MIILTNKDRQEVLKRTASLYGKLLRGQTGIITEDEVEALSLCMDEVARIEAQVRLRGWED
jgi:hypothetical protein